MASALSLELLERLNMPRLLLLRSLHNRSPMLGRGVVHHRAVSSATALHHEYAIRLLLRRRLTDDWRGLTGVGDLLPVQTARLWGSDADADSGGRSGGGGGRAPSDGRPAGRPVIRGEIRIHLEENALVSGDSERASAPDERELNGEPTNKREKRITGERTIVDRAHSYV